MPCSKFLKFDSACADVRGNADALQLPKGKRARARKAMTHAQARIRAHVTLAFNTRAKRGAATRATRKVTHPRADWCVAPAA